MTNLETLSASALGGRFLRLAPVRGARALHAFATIARDPNQLGKVFDLRSSLEDKNRISAVAALFAESELGRRALREQRRIGTLDITKLAAMPKGTLGQSFGQHMLDNGLDPSALPTLESDDRLSFITAHLYETHDIWHVVTGFKTDVAGELGLQAFYLAQFPAFLSAAILSAGLLNTMLFAMDDRNRRMDAIARGWDLGKKSNSLFGIDWTERFHENLENVRVSLGIPREGVAVS
jgi:ubiquinone biosynthesis protein COQ4